MNPNQPLGLPRGSVRALIALALVLATIYGVLASLHAGDAVSGPLAALISLTGIVVQNYFNSKPQSPAS